MQTFLPYPSLKQSVECLDYRRLGKQRVEALMILRMLTMPERKSHWASHPAVKMWRGYETALTAYYNLCIQEWIRRGYNNNMKRCIIAPPIKLPSWFGGPIHQNHREALLYKAARRAIYEGKRDEVDWYSKFGWQGSWMYQEDLSADLPFQHYIWPVR